MSDLHLEMHRDGGDGLIDELDEGSADAVVLAGDISSAEDMPRVFSRFVEKYPAVVYVPGNHELYFGDAAQATSLLRQAARAAGVTMLEPGQTAAVGGRRFVGGTMWFPELPGEAPLRDFLNDFRLIRGFAPWVHQQNAAFAAYMDEALVESDVVVTHHLPSDRSVSPRHHGSPINRFFVSRMDNLIAARRPALWIHGHTHDACDYQIGQTRVVCNPLGYPGEVSDSWRPLVLNV